jgi:hypothetical protein
MDEARAHCCVRWGRGIVPGRINPAARDNRTRRGAPLAIVEHVIAYGGLW